MITRVQAMRFYSMVVLLGAALVAVTQAQDTNALSKVVGATVVDAAKARVLQRLLVTLDDGEVLARRDERLRTRGLLVPGQQEADESAVEYAAMKRSIFPEGKLGQSKVVEDFSHLPVVLVEVPNLESLTQLVSHPQVKLVHEIPHVRPAGA